MEMELSMCNCCARFHGQRFQWLRGLFLQMWAIVRLRLLLSYN